MVKLYEFLTSIFQRYSMNFSKIYQLFTNSEYRNIISNTLKSQYKLNICCANAITAYKAIRFYTPAMAMTSSSLRHLISISNTLDELFSNIEEKCSSICDEFYTLLIIESIKSVYLPREPKYLSETSYFQIESANEIT